MNIAQWIRSFNRNDVFTPTNRVKLLVGDEGVYLSSPYWPRLSNTIRPYGVWVPTYKVWHFSFTNLQTLLGILHSFVQIDVYRYEVLGELGGSIDGVSVPRRGCTYRFNWALHQLFGFPQGSLSSDDTGYVQLWPDIYLDDCINVRFRSGRVVSPGQVVIDLTDRMVNDRRMNRILSDRDFVIVVRGHPVAATSQSVPSANIQPRQIVDAPDEDVNMPGERHVRRIRR